jgi:hypothetical protein
LLTAAQSNNLAVGKAHAIAKHSAQMVGALAGIGKAAVGGALRAVNMVLGGLTSEI